MNKAALKEKLTFEQYHVCCEQGTEAPFSGQYWNCETAGVYHCICCDAPLFSSDTKFDAGCGWPSYWQPITEDSLVFLEDNSTGTRREEVRCGKCDAHLGHVFPDGPEPSGLRYCINSVSLKLDPEAEIG